MNIFQFEHVEFSLFFFVSIWNFPVLPLLSHLWLFERPNRWYMPIIYDIILFPHSFFVVLFTRRGYTKIDTFHPLAAKNKKKIINKISFLPFFWHIEFHSRCSGNSDIEKLRSLAAIKHTINQIEKWYHIDWLGFAIFCATNCVFFYSFIWSFVDSFIFHF